MMDRHSNLAIELALKLVVFLAHRADAVLIEPDRVIVEAAVLAKWANPDALVGILERLEAVCGLHGSLVGIVVASAVLCAVLPDVVVAEAGMVKRSQSVRYVFSLVGHHEVINGDEWWKSCCGGKCRRDKREECQSLHGGLPR